jgi:hypothetical protein
VGYEARVAELLQVLEDSPLSSSCIPDLPNELLGWHQVSTHYDTVCVAAFREYAELISSAIDHVRADGDPQRATELRYSDRLAAHGLAPARWEQFCGMYRMALGSYRYISLSSATASDLALLNRSLQASALLVAESGLPISSPTPSPVAASAGPLTGQAYWELAQAVCAAGRPAEVIIVQVEGANRPVSKREWTAVSNVWQSLRNMAADPAYVRSVGISMLAKERASEAEWLLRHTIDRRELPRALTVSDAAPPVAAFVKEAMGLPAEQRKAAFDSGYRAFYSHIYGSAENFLRDVICSI